MSIEGLSNARPYRLSSQVTKETAETKVRQKESGELKATYTASVGGKEGLKDISLSEPTRFREVNAPETKKAEQVAPIKTDEGVLTEEEPQRLSIDV